MSAAPVPENGIDRIISRHAEVATTTETAVWGDVDLAVDHSCIGCAARDWSGVRHHACGHLSASLLPGAVPDAERGWTAKGSDTVVCHHCGLHPRHELEWTMS